MESIELNPKTVPNEGSSNWIEICSSYFQHVKKILFIIGGYFAVAVEMEELDTIDNQYYENSSFTYQEEKSLQNNAYAEMAFLSSLIFCYKYIPSKTVLTSYLHKYYNQNYLGMAASSQRSSRI